MRPAINDHGDMRADPPVCQVRAGLADENGIILYIAVKNYRILVIKS